MSELLNGFFNWVSYAMAMLVGLFLGMLTKEAKLETVNGEIIVEPSTDTVGRIWIYPAGREGEGFYTNAWDWNAFIADVKRGVYDD